MTWEPTSFRKLCREAGRKKAAERAKSQPEIATPKAAAGTTVEALMLGLRERGTSALIEPKVIRRLSKLSENQIHEVCGRLQRLKPHIAPALAPEQITVLIDAWNACHG